MLSERIERCLVSASHHKRCHRLERANCIEVAALRRRRDRMVEGCRRPATTYRTRKATFEPRQKLGQSAWAGRFPAELIQMSLGATRYCCTVR